jgi:hypothetical protein
MKRVWLLFLAVPLALAACGGHSYQVAPKIDPVAFVRHAAAKTVHTPSEHETMTASMSAAGMQMRMNGGGDFDNARHLGSFDLQLSIAGKTIRMTEVLDGTTIYMHSPQLARNLPQGKTWLRLDFAKLGQSMGLNYSTLMSQDPSHAFARLEAAGQVTTAGQETIDGVPTTHYQVNNLDLAKIPQGTKLEALAHPKYGPIDVWIGNKDGYIRRMELSFTYSVRGVSASMSMTMNASNFGEKVHVHVPQASRTFDVTNSVATHSGTATVPAP